MIHILPHTVLESAQKDPDKIAFSCGAGQLSYAQLAIQCRQLAGVLLQRGVKRGDRVGILLNRSLETAVAVHGIMLAGAAYVPLNPQVPVSELAFQLTDCGIEVLVSNANLKRQLSGLEAETSKLHTIIGWTDAPNSNGISWEEVFSSPEEALLGSALSDDLAYIMYTSGSTGRSKGIMHTHRSGLSFAELSADLCQATQEDRFANHAPLYFDISTFAYFASPLVGATACLTTDAHTIFPASLASWIEQEQISLWYSVPLALIQLLQGQHLQGRDLSSLRNILYAGEACPPKYLRELSTLCPQARISNLYGPAETNVCTFYHLPISPEGDTPIPIGRVWGDTEYLLLDEQQKEVNEPGKGILWIRSSTMMQSYWNRPAQTTNAFLERIGRDGLVKRFYQTGDLVYIDKDGLFHFRGRLDHQVKIRGYRIEIGAVESALSKHPEVSEAVVLTETTAESGVLLHALVIPVDPDKADRQVLLQFLRQQLPAYAVPEKLNFLDHFTRTGSGKVDRGGLRTELAKF